MSRVRLTQRMAADAKIPYPGNVNQPDRKDPDWEAYHTFEQRVNHELPDMRHDWQDDERDDIGFGVPEPWAKSPAVPTVASVRVAANKAVRIAVLLLGEKCDDEVIEAQARDLMSLSQTAMDRTLSRFADTQKLYAEDEKSEEKKAADEKDEDKKAADEKKDEPPAFIQKKIDEKSEEKKAEDKKDEPKEEVKAEDKKDEKKEEVKAEDKKDEEKKAEDKVEDKDEKKAGEAEFTPKVETPGAEADRKASPNEMDIELSGASDEDEEEMDAETAAQLASIFEGKDGTAAEELERKPEASKKAGIKKLGGQPRVASTAGAGATDISSIWATAPDVSEVFK